MISKKDFSMHRTGWRVCHLLAVVICLAIGPWTHGQAPPDEVIAGETIVTAPVGVRNIILMIGDGMGPQQLGLLSMYAHRAPNSVVPDRTPAIERMMAEGTIGLVRTEPHGVLVTDSAAAATQLATGEPAGSEMIGTNDEGNAVPNIVEIAQQQGKSAGLVTDTRITHATPAAFVAHQPHRAMENEIAVDLLEHRVDVMLGGGLRNWTPEAVNNPNSATAMALMQITGGRFPVSSKRTDNRNLLLEARADYRLVFDRDSLRRVKSGRVLGLFADSEMHDALTEKGLLDRDDLTQPTLVEMTSKALDLLSQNPRGFFLMVEGGQIDWAGHNSDVGNLLHELLQFDEAVRFVDRWASQRDDTLLIVTADHETGSFGFSYNGTPLPRPKKLSGNVFQEQKFQPDFNFAPLDVLDKIYSQKKSYFQLFQEFDAQPAGRQTAEQLVTLVNASLEFEITLDDAVDILARTRNRQYAAGHPYLGTPTVPRIRDFDSFYVYGENSRMNLLGRTVAAQQNVVWGTGTHTSTPVVLVAKGPAAHGFAGMHHATEIGRRMIQLISGNPTGSPLGTAHRSSQVDNSQ